MKTELYNFVTLFSSPQNSKNVGPTENLIVWMSFWVKFSYITQNSTFWVWVTQTENKFWIFPNFELKVNDSLANKWNLLGSTLVSCYFSGVCDHYSLLFTLLLFHTTDSLYTHSTWAPPLYAQIWVWDMRYAPKIWNLTNIFSSEGKSRVRDMKFSLSYEIWDINFEWCSNQTSFSFLWKCLGNASR